MKLVTLMIALTISFAIPAQQPVTWNFSAKKLNDKMYEVSMTATVPSPWHIYSQNTPEGGPLPTVITFTINPLASIEGKTTETGKAITKLEEVFGINVVYYTNTVSFVQKVKVEKKVKTNISGSIEYMVCNDTQCLPPKTVPFTVALK